MASVPFWASRGPGRRTPKAHVRTPKARARTPKALARTPKAHAHTPKARACTSKAYARTPKVLEPAAEGAKKRRLIYLIPPTNASEKLRRAQASAPSALLRVERR